MSSNVKIITYLKLNKPEKTMQVLYIIYIIIYYRFKVIINKTLAGGFFNLGIFMAPKEYEVNIKLILLK